ncbi:hypothetical protein Mapa_003600 [Marchantia paleacea]|nr:hypothetical protein Mapa_003600 [Marchantia paleacea]
MCVRKSNHKHGFDAPNLNKPRPYFSSAAYRISTLGLSRMPNWSANFTQKVIFQCLTPKLHNRSVLLRVSSQRDSEPS